MRVGEAKDFLVAQTAEQAALEGVSLSDLEKRMMYFTETGECPEDPIALNDAFEAEYGTPAYEKKISLLMARAYRRIKRESPESALMERRVPRPRQRRPLHSLYSGDRIRLGDFTDVANVCSWRAPWPACNCLTFFFGNRRGLLSGEQARATNIFRL